MKNVLMAAILHQKTKEYFGLNIVINFAVEYTFK